jgi:rhodanese-related sulfurtransferase
MCACLLTIICASPALSQTSSWQWITPQRVHGLVKEGSGLWIVDVRTPIAFEQGHIEGALNIPVDLLKIKNFPKGKIIVLADDSLGLRNARAGADALLKKGYQKVFLLDRGMQAWQQEGLPVAGARLDKLRPVTWDDLNWARSNSIPLRIYDLRDPEERAKGPVEGAAGLKGKTVEERLKAFVAGLGIPAAGKGLAAMLEMPAPVVLVLPAANQPLESVRTSLRDLSGDFRYLEGAYPIWAAREKQNPLPGPEACPTCPGGRTKK